MSSLIFWNINFYCLSFGVCVNLERNSFVKIRLWNFAVFAKNYRSRSPYVFLGKDVLKIFRKFTGEYHCRSVISIKLLCKNILKSHFGIGFFSINLLQIFRMPFLKITPGGILLELAKLLRRETDSHKFTFFCQRFPCPFAIL